MSGFVTLGCPSCGGKLKVGSDVDLFACADCGAEHVVRRGEGVVALTPPIAGIQQARTGAEKTVSELAIRWMNHEIAVRERPEKRD
jgi:hypothetical protein